MVKQIETGDGVIIQNVYWERIFLHFTIKSSFFDSVEFALKNLRTQENIPLEIEEKEGGDYRFCLNITAVNGRDFLDNGDWTIAYRLLEAPDYHPCFVEIELGYRLEELSKIFRYGDGEFAYTINFEIFSENQKNLELRIKSYFMRKNERWRERKNIYKTGKTRVGKYIDCAITKFLILGINAWYRFFGWFRKRNVLNLLLMNETSRLNAGNLEAIDRRLKERGIDKKINVSHSFRQAVGKGTGVWSWIKLLTKIAMQDIIILDNFAPIFSLLKLRKDVELIQVWHAGGGFKAVGYCRFGKEGSPYPVGSCHKAYTMALTGSKELVKVFEEVFGIEKSAFFPVGMPRLDGYLEADRISKFQKKFYEKYPQFIDKKIILFAPTYRGEGQRSAYYDYNMVDLKQIRDICGSEYVFLVKMHPFISEPFPIPEEYKDKIFDFTSFPSINELFYVTEVLITDYSSNFYEFSLMKKPIIFYTYDRYIYELTRGVYRGVKESAPGKVCDTFEELVETLKNKDYEYEKVIKFVEENFNDVTGGATDKLINHVVLKNRKYKDK